MVEYLVDPDGRFKQAVISASQAVGDLTVPFQQITKSWYQGNKAIFSLKGPGQYQDLSPDYKKQKQKNYGFIYPILRAGGTLEDSITNASSEKTISRIINKNILELGTSVDYGVYHQSLEPRNKIPFRPFLFIGAEQQAPSQLQTRRDAWIAILGSWVDQVLAQKGVTS